VLSVLLVEDDTFTLSTLADALSLRGLHILAALATAREALAFTGAPDVAVLDLDLGPGPCGVDLAIALRQRLPSIGLVLLTTYDDPRLISGDLPPVPFGTRYLRKGDVDSPSVVITAIRSAAQRPLEGIAITQSTLTPSQVDTLRLIAQGLSNLEIAQHRGVSRKAVEGTIARLCEHFDVHADSSRNQRVRLATEYFTLTGQAPR